MAVVNEDQYELSFTKGLYKAGSAGGNDAPPGFCTLLINMIADGQRLRTRPNFSTYSNYRVNIANTTPTANLEMTDSYNVYSKLRRVWAVGGGVNKPNLIWQAWKGTSTIGTLLSNDTGNAPLSAHGNSAWVTYASPGSKFYTSFNQYAASIYGSTAASGIRKFTSWDPTAPGNGSGTAADAAVAGSPNSQGLVFFRDRFFGWNGDTLYYTELATTSPGGLPEVWNTGTNVIRVPSNLANIVIWDVMVFNDRLLIWTSAGLYSLKTMGNPLTDWLWQTIDENIKVNAQVQCVQARGVVYYVDDTGVWSYNGDKFNLLSAAISNYFDIKFDVAFIDNPIYAIYPVHDGLMLCIKQPAVVVTGGGTPFRWDVGQMTILYYSFKWGTWCQWDSAANYDPTDMLGSVADHRSAVHGGQATSWMLMRLDGMLSNLQFYEVDFAGFSEELYDPLDTFPVPGTISDEILLSVDSFITDIDKPWKLKHIKYAFLDTYYFGVASQMLDYNWRNEEFDLLSSNTVDINPVLSNVQSKFIKLEAGFYAREIYLQLRIGTNQYIEIKSAYILDQLGRDELRAFEGEGA